MRRFNWITWLLALGIIFLFFYGIGTLIGPILYKSWTHYESAFTSIFVCMWIFWLISNTAPRIGGVLRIDTTRDNKDVWRFELSDEEEFKNGEFVTIKVVKGRVFSSSDELIGELEDK